MLLTRDGTSRAWCWLGWFYPLEMQVEEDTAGSLSGMVHNRRAARGQAACHTISIMHACTMRFPCGCPGATNLCVRVRVWGWEL